MPTQITPVEPDALATPNVTGLTSTNVDVVYARGLIDAAGDRDFYSLTAAPGQIISAHATGADGPGVDTVLRLLDGGGNQLATNDDFGGTLDPYLQFTVVTAGTYTVEVRAFSAVVTNRPYYVFVNNDSQLDAPTINADALNGNATPNLLPGYNGNDAISAGAGSDYLEGGIGADQLTGGPGNDLYLADNTDTLVEAPNEGTDSVLTASATFTLTPNVENLEFFGAGNFIGTGNGSDNFILGSIGTDQLNGLGGNDLLIGGAGPDQMVGGTGDDTMFVDNTADTVTENANEGNDQVYSSLASYTLAPNVETLRLIEGSAATQGIGNELNNVIFGNAAANTLIGAEGDDILLGLGGADQMFGGIGNDTYYVDDAGDIVGEAAGQGIDTVHATISYTIAEPVEILYLEGTATTGNGNGNDNTIVGNDQNNFLNGFDGNDTLFGFGGTDVMAGGRGVDVYYVDNPGDIVTENFNEGYDVVVSAATAYTLSPNVEVLFLTGPAVSGTGNELDNTLAGNDLANVLSGGAGNDTFNGGAGADTSTGGTGVDVFLFTRGQANGDTVTDFSGVGDGDRIGFIGYGQGSFIRLNATQYQVTSQDGLTVETINFQNGVTINTGEFLFL